MTTTERFAGYSWACKDTSVANNTANLDNIQKSQINNNIQTLLDKNMKEAMKYAYSNQIVNSVINEETSTSSLSSMIDAINQMEQTNTAKISITRSSDIKDISLDARNELSQAIVSAYMNKVNEWVKSATDTTNVSGSGSKSDVGNRGSAATDNGITSNTNMSSGNKQSGNQKTKANTFVSYGETYFPESIITQALRLMNKESCGGLISFVNRDSAVTNNNLNLNSQQLTNLDQNITTNCHENIDLSQNFDIAMSTIVENITRTNNTVVSDTKMELKNMAKQVNEFTLTITDSHDIYGLNINMSNEGQQSIYSLELVSNVLKASISNVTKGLILDILGLIARQDADSKTTTKTSSSNSTQMTNTQQMTQKASSKVSTGAVAVVIIIIVIVLVFALVFGGEREEDDLFNKHGTKEEKS